MYKSILVPLDGSKLAEGVLPYARFLAEALKLPVDLLHVRDRQTVAPSLYPTQGADYLRRVAAGLPASLEVSCAVESGSAAEAILDRGSKDPAALIAMATHGQTGARRWLLGSVAQKVLQSTKNPLLLIRPREDASAPSAAKFASLIVPLDGSHLAEKTLPSRY